MTRQNIIPPVRIIQTGALVAFLCAVAVPAQATPARETMEREKVAPVQQADSSENANRAPEPAAEGILKGSRTYTVQSGDMLGAIAKAHGVRLTLLMEANQIDDPDQLREGQELVIPTEANQKKKPAAPKGVSIVVPKGITLSRIAELYEIPVRRIVQANRIANPDRLRSGQKLFIPGVSKVVELIPPPPCFKAPVEFYRVQSDETRRISLLFCDGRPNPAAVEQLSALSGPIKKKRPFDLDQRLLPLLQKISDHFPKKRIEVISGQRTRKSPGQESYHNKGQALDFRVAGISNKVLSRYVRTLGSVGVGYYPNSVFIHMDVRDKSAYWVDYSRPGEKAIYGRADMTRAEIEAIRQKRQTRETCNAIAANNQTIQETGEDEGEQDTPESLKSILETVGKAADKQLEASDLPVPSESITEESTPAKNAEHPA